MFRMMMRPRLPQFSGIVHLFDHVLTVPRHERLNKMPEYKTVCCNYYSCSNDNMHAALYVNTTTQLFNDHEHTPLTNGIVTGTPATDVDRTVQDRPYCTNYHLSTIVVDTSITKVSRCDYLLRERLPAVDNKPGISKYYKYA